MTKLSIEDLKKIKEKVLKEDLFRTGDKRVKINVHMGTCGIASGAKEIFDTILREIQENNVNDVLVTASGCIGICSREPLITVEEQGKEPVIYAQLTPEKMRQIFKRHIMAGEIQTAFVMALGKEQDERRQS